MPSTKIDEGILSFVPFAAQVIVHAGGYTTSDACLTRREIIE